MKNTQISHINQKEVLIRINTEEKEVLMEVPKYCSNTWDKCVLLYLARTLSQTSD